MKPMTVLSLFDGISGGQLALNRINIPIKNYYASEIDKYAIQVTQDNFPNTIQLGDVSKISYEKGILYTPKKCFNIGKVDILLFGSPCQSFSFAGKRQGMVTNDNIEVTKLVDYLHLKEQGYEFQGQSYLFWEACRLLKEINPTYFLCENVKMSKKWEDIISFALNATPNKINSNLFTAQNRDRLYWTNINNGNIPLPQDKGVLLKDIIEENVDEKYNLSKKHYDGFIRNYNWKGDDINGKSRPILASYYKQPPHCPYIPCATSESGYRRLTPNEAEKLQSLPIDYTKSVSETQRYKGIGNGWTIDVIAYILSFIKNDS